MTTNEIIGLVLVGAIFLTLFIPAVIEIGNLTRENKQLDREQKEKEKAKAAASAH